MKTPMKNVDHPSVRASEQRKPLSLSTDLEVILVFTLYGIAA